MSKRATRKSGGAPFQATWRDAVLASELSAAAKVVAVAIGQFANADGTNVWPSIAAVATRARTSVRNVERHRPVIVRAGLLEQVAPAIRGARGVEYRLTTPDDPPAMGNPELSKTDTSRAKTDNSGGQRPTGVADNQFSNQSTRTNNWPVFHPGDENKAKVNTLALYVAGACPCSGGNEHYSATSELPPYPTDAQGNVLSSWSSLGYQRDTRERIERIANLREAHGMKRIPNHRPEFYDGRKEQKDEARHRGFHDRANAEEQLLEAFEDDPKLQHYVEMVQSGEIRDWQEVPPPMQEWASKYIASSGRVDIRPRRVSPYVRG